MKVADETPQGAVPVEPPRGMYPARLDEKGRLKLPVEFQKYLAGLAEKKLFVTSKDRRMATVYPIEIWRENEKLLANFRDNPKALQRVWFTSQDLGTEAEMDGPVRVLVVHGAIQVMSEEMFQARRAEAAQSVEDDLEVLERAGFK